MENNIERQLMGSVLGWGSWELDFLGTLYRRYVDFCDKYHIVEEDISDNLPLWRIDYLGGLTDAIIYAILDNFNNAVLLQTKILLMGKGEDQEDINKWRNTIKKRIEISCNGHISYSSIDVFDQGGEERILMISTLEDEEEYESAFNQLIEDYYYYKANMLNKKRGG